jgi:hypothetical protein
MRMIGYPLRRGPISAMSEAETNKYQGRGSFAMRSLAPVPTARQSRTCRGWLQRPLQPHAGGGTPQGRSVASATVTGLPVCSGGTDNPSVRAKNAACWW